jgi:heme A synthase
MELGLWRTQLSWLPSEVHRRHAGRDLLHHELVPRPVAVAFGLFFVLALVGVVGAFTGMDAKARLALHIAQIPCLAIYFSWWWRHRRRR